MKFSSLHFIAIFISLTSVFRYSNVTAAPEEFCKRYAQEAIKSQQQNATKNCGFSGPGGTWSNNYNEHYNWCIETPQGDVKQGANHRRNLLARCDNCAGYAKEAVEAQKKNVAKNCGFSGPGGTWSSGYNEHFSWCVSTSQSESDGGANHRRNLLARCDNCAGYAKEAVEAQKKNVANDCGYTSGVPNGTWSENYNAHFGWCTSSPDDLSTQGTQERRSALEKCTKYCVSYANQAIDAQKQNISMNCGFSGPGGTWLNDYNEHFRWCVNNPEYLSERGTSYRLGYLEVCKDRKEICQEYANSAVAQNQDNISKAWGFHGPEWHGDFNKHLWWCLDPNTPDKYINDGTSFRKNKLASCKLPKHPPRPKQKQSMAIKRFLGLEKFIIWSTKPKCRMECFRASRTQILDWENNGSS